jgi:nicotinamide-nucleotide amidase
MLKKKGKTLSTAESCTGGKIAAVLTSIPGASEYFKGSIVSYATEAKIAV